MANDSVNNLLALHQSGQHEAAVAAARALIAQHPNSIGINFILGLSLHALRRFEEGIAAFEQELTLTKELKIENKNADRAWKGILLCAQSLGQSDLLFAMAKKYWKERPSTESGLILMDVALAFDGQIELIQGVFKLIYPDTFKDRPTLGVTVGERRSLKDWCAAHNAEYFELEPAEDVERAGPVKGMTIRYRSTDVFVATIPNAISICGWDFVIAPDGEVLEDSGYSKIKTSYYFMPHLPGQVSNRVAYLRSSESVEIEDDALFLSCPESFVFGHWILDFLQRLMAWRIPGRKPLKIFCPEKLPHHHRDTLALFGVQPEDIIEGELGRQYRFGSLTVVRTADLTEPPPSVVQFLYDALGPNKTPRLEGEREAIVFLERSQTNRGRYVGNKDEFNAVLKEFGTITIRRPELSITYQNALLARTSIAIGVFGSDLAAIYQLRPYSDVIVIYFSDMDSLTGDAGLDLCFIRTCALLKLRVHQLFCAAAPSDTRKAFRRDVLINCQELRDKLVEVLAARKALLQPSEVTSS